jgi:hypothetical protein
MTDAVAADGRLVAVAITSSGRKRQRHVVDLTDGLTWTPAPRAAALNQGEMIRSRSGRTRLRGGRTFRRPEHYVPTVWLSPRS